jgi:glutathionyl-hydroquinone reductase
MDEQRYAELRYKIMKTMNEHYTKRPPKKETSNKATIPSVFEKTKSTLKKENIEEIKELLSTPSPETSPRNHQTLPRTFTMKMTHKRKKTLTAEIINCLGDVTLIEEEKK